MHKYTYIKFDNDPDEHLSVERLPLFRLLLCIFSLEMLDKVDPPMVPDGYGLSVGFYCLVEAVRTIQVLVEGEKPDKTSPMKQADVKQAASGEPISGIYFVFLYQYKDNVIFTALYLSFPATTMYIISSR